MKKLLFLITLITLVVIPLMAATSGFADPALWASLSPLIVLIISPLLVRLFKKLGIDINQSIIESILTKIIEIIARVEEKFPDQIGSVKKQKVVEMAQNILSKKEITIVNKAFGSVSTAVQAAFERSYTGSK